MEEAIRLFRAGGGEDVLGALAGPAGTERAADALVPWPEGDRPFDRLRGSLPSGSAVLGIVLSGTEALDRFYSRHGAAEVPGLSWIVLFPGETGLPRVQAWVFDRERTAFYEEVVILR